MIEQRKIKRTKERNQKSRNFTNQYKIEVNKNFKYEFKTQKNV